MTSCLSRLDSGVRVVGEGLEEVFRGGREYGLPQYKYLSFPIYKACSEKIGRIAAVGVSCLMTDLIAHQLLEYAACNLSNYVWDQQDCQFSYNIKFGLFSCATAGLVMYAKYRRKCDGRVFLIKAK